jgi:ribonuclease HI
VSAKQPGSLSGDAHGGASRAASPEELVAYVDGGSRGNPGPAGAGVYFESGGAPWRGLWRFLGHRTNNYAEYSALLAALDYAIAGGCRRLRVRADSELMVRQISGQYRVKNANLQPLHAQASAKIEAFERFSIEHVPRARNARADALANRAMDSRLDGEERYETD